MVTLLFNSRPVAKQTKLVQTTPLKNKCIQADWNFQAIELKLKG